MRRVVIADTGPLYAATDPADSYHRRARTEMSRLRRESREVLLAYPILCEAYSLVVYRLGRLPASNWLEEVLRGVSILNPTPEDYFEATKKLSAFSDQKITLFDAVVAVLARRLGAEVWTYDRHFDLMRASVWR